MDYNKGASASENKSQRSIHPIIKKILDIDKDLSKRLVSFFLNFVPFRSIKKHCKFLEVGTTHDI